MIHSNTYVKYTDVKIHLNTYPTRLNPAHDLHFRLHLYKKNIMFKISWVKYHVLTTALITTPYASACVYWRRKYEWASMLGQWSGTADQILQRPSPTSLFYDPSSAWLTGWWSPRWWSLLRRWLFWSTPGLKASHYNLLSIWYTTCVSAPSL